MQGGNLAMPFQAVRITLPLQALKIKCLDIEQIFLTDDIVGAGKVKNLKIWDQSYKEKEMGTVKNEKNLE